MQNDPQTDPFVQNRCRFDLEEKITANQGERKMQAGISANMS